MSVADRLVERSRGTRYESATHVSSGNCTPARTLRQDLAVAGAQRNAAPPSSVLNNEMYDNASRPAVRFDRGYSSALLNTI